MKHYESIQKKYNLPSVEELNKYFQLEDDEDKHFILIEIIKKIQEKISTFLHLMDELLNPETISTSHESNMFTDDEKKTILKLYQQLHYLNRKKLLTEIEYDEEICANYVNEAYNEYSKMISELKKITIKVKDSWNNKSEKRRIELSYFG